MPQLRGRARDALPDSAFAYVDSTGRRRLPIHDEAHVRNALARFDRVDFEDETARDRAERGCSARRRSTASSRSASWPPKSDRGESSRPAG
jgi:hypothetical protein